MADRQSEPAQQRGHHLIVTKDDDDFDPEYPYFKTAVVCLSPAKCGGWQECRESHEMPGMPTNDGPWDSDESAPWCDQDYFTFHGVEHEWRSGYGWTVPFEGCVVAADDSVGDNAHDIGVAHGEGTYLVDDDWDDEYVTLAIIERVVTPPRLPDGGGSDG